MPFRRAIIPRPYTGALGVGLVGPPGFSIAVNGMNEETDAVDGSVLWDRDSISVRGSPRMGEFTSSGSTGPAASFSDGEFYIGELTAARPRATLGQNPALNTGFRATPTFNITQGPLGGGNIGSGNMAARAFLFADSVGDVWRDTVFARATANALRLENVGDSVLAVGSLGAGDLTGVVVVLNADDVVVASAAVVVSGAGSASNVGDSVAASGAVIVSVAGSFSNGSDALVGAGAITVSGAVFVLNGDDAVVAAGAATRVATVLVVNGDDLVVAAGEVLPLPTATTASPLSLVLTAASSAALIGISDSSGAVTLSTSDGAVSVVVLTEPAS